MPPQLTKPNGYKSLVKQIPAIRLRRNDDILKTAGLSEKLKKCVVGK